MNPNTLICPHCHRPNVRTSTQCVACERPFVDDRPTPPQAPITTRRVRIGRGFLIGVVLMLIAAAFPLYNGLLPPREQTAHLVAAYHAAVAGAGTNPAMDRCTLARELTARFAHQGDQTEASVWRTHAQTDCAAGDIEIR
jgi:hypothetical protein